MATWGVGVFENDDALDFVADTMDDMYKVVEEFFHQDEPNYIEDGEGIIIPRLKLMVMMAKIGREVHDPIIRCAPPEKPTIQHWREKYLSGFDAQIDQYEPEEEYKTERRRVIESVFDNLDEESDLLDQSMEESEKARIAEENEFLMVAQLIDDDPEVILRCAEIFLERENWEQAVKKYEQVIELGIDEMSEPFAYNNLAWCYAQVKNYDKAFDAIDHAIEQAVAAETVFPHFYGTLGFILFSVGKYESALKEYNKALETNDSAEEQGLYDPSLAETHYWRSKVHAKMGNKAKQEEDLKMIKALGCKVPDED